MGATVAVHHLQNQIESNDFTVWNQQGVWDGKENVLPDIKTKEHGGGVILLHLDMSQLLMLIF